MLSATFDTAVPTEALLLQFSRGTSCLTIFLHFLHKLQAPVSLSYFHVTTNIIGRQIVIQTLFTVRLRVCNVI